MLIVIFFDSLMVIQVVLRIYDIVIIFPIGNSETVSMNSSFTFSKFHIISDVTLHDPYTLKYWYKSKNFNSLLLRVIFREKL